MRRLQVATVNQFQPLAMSSRGLISSTHHGAGRQSSSRGSWRRSSSTAASSTNAGRVNEVLTEGEKGPHSGNSKEETRKFNPQVRPTHFLSLPLGGHSSLRSRVQAFTDALLLADPPIPGLDRSIIVQPSRLHITLGVMTLREDSRESVQVAGTTPENLSEPQPEPPPKTISEALALLRGLRGRITEELRTQGDPSSDSGILMVPLNTMGALRTDKKWTAHVLWIGPKKSHDTTALDRVSDLVNKAFREHGFITEKRPLKLHCTILNTKYRKGGIHKRPAPFSTEAIFASDAYRNLMRAPSNSPTTTHAPTPSHDASIECGTWAIDEIQLCQMLGRDPATGAYISVGSLRLS